MRETIEATLPDPAEATALGTLRRDEHGPKRFALSLGQAHAAGAQVDWERFFEGTDAKRVPLPTYPFQRERYWLDELSQVDGDRAGDDPAQAGFWDAVDRGDLDELAGMLSVDEGAASLGDVVPALAAWRRRGRELSALDGLRYRERWSPIADRPGALAPGRWLVVISPGQREDADVAAVLAALGDGAAQAELDPGEGKADLQAACLRDAVASLEPGEVEGVLSLLALAERSPQASPAWDALSATDSLLRGLDLAGLDAPVWLATSGAVSTASTDPVRHPSQAQLWGYGRCFALEQPGRWGGLVDLPMEFDEEMLGRLCGVLGGAAAGDQIALREAGAFARVLVRAPVAVSESGESWSPDGTVLLSGAGRRIREIAGWLADSGARSLLILVPREPEVAEMAELEVELTEVGCLASVAACHPADRQQLAELLASLPEEQPLRAVFYAADADEEARTSVDGSRNLHELTADLDLSAFVLISSSAASLGAAGSGVEAAAGAFLNSLAMHRRALGLPATSVAWDISKLAPETAMVALQHALDHDETGLTVGELDAVHFAPLRSATPPQTAIEEVPETERAAFLLELVRGEVARVLGHDSAQAIEPAIAFKELGFDSLAAVELRDRLQTATGMRLPATVVFNHPTSLRLAERLLVEATERPAAEPGRGPGRRRRGADRDRRHGLPVSRWGDVARGALGAGRRRRRRDFRFSHRPRMGPRASL